MTDKFKDIPVDEDTQITSSVQVKIDKYDVVYQKWHWEGIRAQSIVFFNEDVSDMSEEQIIHEVELCPGLINEKSKITFKRGEKYTFVNFNFETD